MSPEAEVRLSGALKVPPPSPRGNRQIPNQQTIARYLDTRFAPTATKAINDTLGWLRRRNWSPCTSAKDFVVLVWSRCDERRDEPAVVDRRAREIYERCAEERRAAHARHAEDSRVKLESEPGVVDDYSFDDEF